MIIAWFQSRAYSHRRALAVRALVLFSLAPACAALAHGTVGTIEAGNAGAAALRNVETVCRVIKAHEFELGLEFGTASERVPCAWYSSYRRNHPCRVRVEIDDASASDSPHWKVQLLCLDQRMDSAKNLAAEIRDLLEDEGLNVDVHTGLAIDF